MLSRCLIQVNSAPVRSFGTICRISSGLRGNTTAALCTGIRGILGIKSLSSDMLVACVGSQQQVRYCSSNSHNNIANANSNPTCINAISQSVTESPQLQQQQQQQTEMETKVLYDALLSWRKQIGKDLRLSPKSICNLTALRYVAQAKPISLESMYSIAGLPHEFIVLWGTMLVPLVQKHVAQYVVENGAENVNNANNVDIAGKRDQLGVATATTTAKGNGLFIPRKPQGNVGLRPNSGSSGSGRVMTTQNTTIGGTCLYNVAENLRRSSEKYSDYSIHHRSLTKEQQVITDHLLETNRHIFLTSGTSHGGNIADAAVSSSVTADSGSRKHILHYLLQEWSYRHLQQMTTCSSDNKSSNVTNNDQHQQKQQKQQQQKQQQKHNSGCGDTVITSCCEAGAVLLGGESIYKFAKIRSCETDPEVLFRRIMAKSSLATRWLQMSRLVIDDINLLPGHVFALLERTARLIRGNNEYFGGIQLVCCGDFLCSGPPAPFYSYGTFGTELGLDIGRPKRRGKKLFGEHDTKRSKSAFASDISDNGEPELDFELMMVSRQWCFQTDLWKKMGLDQPVILTPITAAVAAVTNIPTDVDADSSAKDSLGVATDTGINGVDGVDYMVVESPQSNCGMAVHLDMLTFPVNFANTHASPSPAAYGYNHDDVVDNSSNTTAEYSTRILTSAADPTTIVGYAAALSAVRHGQVSDDLVHVLSTCNVMFKPLPSDGIAPIMLHINSQIDADRVNREMFSVLQAQEDNYHYNNSYHHEENHGEMTNHSAAVQAHRRERQGDWRNGNMGLTGSDSNNSSDGNTKVSASVDMNRSTAAARTARSGETEVRNAANSGVKLSGPHRQTYIAMDSWPLEKLNAFEYVSTTVCNSIAAEMNNHYICTELTLSLGTQVVLLIDLNGYYPKQETSYGFLDSAEVCVKAGSVGVVTGFLHVPIAENISATSTSTSINTDTNTVSDGNDNEKNASTPGHISASMTTTNPISSSSSNVARVKHTNTMFSYVPIVRFGDGVELPVYGVQWVYSSHSWSPTGKLQPLKLGFSLVKTASGGSLCTPENHLLPSTTCLRSQLPLKLGYASNIHRVPFFGQYINPKCNSNITSDYSTDDAIVGVSGGGDSLSDTESTVLTTVVTRHDRVQVVMPQTVIMNTDFNTVAEAMSCVNSLNSLWFSRHLTPLVLNAMPGAVSFYAQLQQRALNLYLINTNKQQ